MAQVREELASGQAHEAGTVTIAEVSLYRIDLPHGLIGYFDTVDYCRATSMIRSGAAGWCGFGSPPTSTCR